MTLSKKVTNQIPLHLMIFPAVVILFIYHIIPMFGAVIAFENYFPGLGFFKSQWVGLENFKFLFSTPDFARAMFNTVFIAVMKIITGIIVPVTFALLLNEIAVSKIKRPIQTIVYLPHFISWVLLSSIIIDILSPSNGIVNNVLGIFGIEPIFFLGDNRWFPYMIVATHVWKEFGWGTIIYMAALTGIDPSLYESAIVDGAGRWKQTVHITLPGILPTIILLTTLSLGNILNAGFDQVFNLVSPVTYQSGDIIDTLVYRLGIESAQFSIATAAGLFKSVISFFLIVFSYKLAYRFAGYRIF